MRALRLLTGLVVLLLAGLAPAAGLPTVTHEGRDYVELARAAELLKTRLEAAPNGTQARLRPSGHVVTLTRNWSRILIDGSPVILDAPVRVRRGVWLVPDTFVAQVLPRVQSAAAASPPTSAPAVPVAPVAAAAPAARPMPGYAAACRASRRPARAPRAPRPPGATPRARASGPRPRPRHPRARSPSRQSPPSAPRSPAATKSAGPVGTSRRGAHMAACSPLAPHHLPAPVLPRCHMLPAQALRREHPSADRAHLLSHCRPLAAFPGLVERAGSRGVTLARRAPGLL